MSEQLTKPVFECTDNLTICQMSPIFVFLFLHTTTTLRNSSCVRKDPEERFGENPQPQFWYSHSTCAVHLFFIFPKCLPQFEVLKEGFQHERGPVAQISPNLAGRPSVIDEPVDFSHFVPPAPLLPLWLPPKLLPYANYSPLLPLFSSMADWRVIWWNWSQPY